MADYNPFPEAGPDDLVLPFIFVPKGDPEPTEWLAEHPGAIRIPAVMVPHTISRGSRDWRLQFDLNTALTGIMGEVLPAAQADIEPLLTKNEPDWVEPEDLRSDPIDPVSAYISAMNKLAVRGLAPATGCSDDSGQQSDAPKVLASADTPAAGQHSSGPEEVSQRPAFYAAIKMIDDRGKKCGARTVRWFRPASTPNRPRPRRQTQLSFRRSVVARKEAYLAGPAHDE